MSASKTPARRDADPSAGAGASVEADAGEGQVSVGGGEAEGVTRSFVNRLLRLTLLAPDIQEAIFEGRQPKGMRLEDLTRATLSGWEEQRRRFLTSLRPST